MKFLTIFLLLIATLHAATDPFVGKWNFDRKASQLEPDYEIIEGLGGNRFTIREGPLREPTINTFTADGVSRPANFDRTLAVKPEGKNAWRVLWKWKDGARDESVWSVTPDDRCLKMLGAYYDNDGRNYPVNKTYDRISGETGLVGKWKLSDLVIQTGSYLHIELRSFERDGLSFVVPSGKVWLNLNFDGKEYPDLITPNSVTTARRPNPSSFETTGKFNGKVVDQSEFKVSPDAKTLTITVHDPAGQVTNVFVYNRVSSFSTN